LGDLGWTVGITLAINFSNGKRPIDQRRLAGGNRPMLLSRIAVIAAVVTSLRRCRPLGERPVTAPMLGTTCETGAVLEANANGGAAEVGNPVPDGASFEQFGESSARFGKLRRPCAARRK